MKTETREVYKCDHCNRLYQIKHFCISHEPKCKKNPDNKQRCFDGCNHLVKKDIKYSVHMYDGEHVEAKGILYCEAKKEGVYPYWINGMDQADIHEEIPNNPMPKECDKFK